MEDLGAKRPADLQVPSEAKWLEFDADSGTRPEVESHAAQAAQQMKRPMEKAEKLKDLELAFECAYKATETLEGLEQELPEGEERNAVMEASCTARKLQDQLRPLMDAALEACRVTPRE